MSNVGGIIMVNADPTGAVDALPAFNSAIAALGPDGGVVNIPTGRFLLDGQLTLPPHENVWLRGSGIGSTSLISTVTSGPAILFSTGATSGRRQQLSDFLLQRFDLDGSYPAFVAGNFGIAATGAVGEAVPFRNVDVRGFGDAGFSIDCSNGGTGSLLIESCYVFQCAGYGMQFTAGAANITVLGGGLQQNAGGIYYDGAAGGQSFTLIAPDIEVGILAKLPALRIVGAGGGVAVLGGSFSLGESSGGSIFSVTPNAVISIESSRGITLHSALVSAYNGSDNLQIDDGSDHSIIGGLYTNNPASNGYLATVINGAKRLSFANMNVYSPSYIAGRDIINDPNWATSGSSAFGLKVGTNPSQASFATPIDIAAGSGLKVANTAVVGARKTGWTAATGTESRNSFDTATVTLPVLAQHVKALLDDLTAHGLIGS